MRTNINSKLKLALIRHLAAKSSNSQGFVLPMVIGLGLVITLIGITMIVRSGDDKVNAVMQEQSSQSLSIAESGISRVASQLLQARGLLQKSYVPAAYAAEFGLGAELNEWGTLTARDIVTGTNQCPPPANNNNEPYAFQKVPVTAQTIDLGTYQLLAYYYNNGKGTLLVEGIKGTEEIDRSQNRVKVQIPITDRPDTNPGIASVMANKINLKQSDVTGKITCTDATLCPITCVGTEPTLNELRAAIGASSGNAVITNPDGGLPDIKVSSMKIPDIPKAPANATVHSLGDITSGSTFNPASYAASPDGNYYFQIANIDITGNAFEIQTSGISNTAKVIFYVSGDIDQGGNGDIKPVLSSGQQPTLGQIRIYGGSSDGTMPTSQRFALSGNACTMAFIHAPKADLSIDGGGNGCSDLPSPMTGTNVYGAVWANTYNELGNTSNSSIFYEQPGLMSIIAGENNGNFMIPSMDEPTSWERRPVN
jgi:hypothetical protein